MAAITKLVSMLLTLGVIGAPAVAQGSKNLAKTGVYRGTATTLKGQSSPSFVTIGVKNDRIIALAYKFHLQCSDGSVRTVRGDLTPDTRPVTKTDGNRFGFTGTDQTTTLSIDGVFFGSANKPRIAGKVAVVDTASSLTCVSPGKNGSSAAEYTDTWVGSNPSPD